ncbi:MULTISPECIES: hypothetical protein [Bacillus]|uniref:hypothetical protein n=1 Tax=Bacillus TaxID=1386 RepID=UPI00077A8C00|nr:MULTISPECIES: hypothetical protein [Bacillus cereus group]KAA6457671.1 hypothetical protein DX930_29490 [Bacillus cereus]KAB2397347.1 hypothetical protein F8171_06695 [Bacillus cereus]KAB2412542.1 hypothetical protein F8169_30650 [Bacillus cereus]KAB2435171.1 hypothetical protein F8166_17960 [Bacillus cereus]KAB2466645.1 hypothetical protein F8164_13765 [Bacillus cereus]
MKKIVMGFISFAAVLTIGSFTESYTSQADHGRPPAPQRPDYISADGNTGLVTLDHGRPPAPAYEYSYIDNGEQI